jgi:hypothetical protein
MPPDANDKIGTDREAREISKFQVSWKVKVIKGSFEGQIGVIATITGVIEGNKSVPEYHIRFSNGMNVGTAREDELVLANE